MYVYYLSIFLSGDILAHLRLERFLVRYAPLNLREGLAYQTPLASGKIYSLWFNLLYALFVGMNNKRGPRDWEYLPDGTASIPIVSYTNWGKNQPQIRGKRDRRNCVLVNKRRKWKNKSCNRNVKRFICEGIPNQQFSSSQFSPSDQPKRYRDRRRRRFRWSS